MKKLFSFFLALLTVLSLCACGADEADTGLTATDAESSSWKRCTRAGRRSTASCTTMPPARTATARPR